MEKQDLIVSYFLSNEAMLICNFRALRSDLSLRISTGLGDSNNIWPSNYGVFNLINEPPHRLDALVFGNFSDYGCGLDFAHEDLLSTTLILEHCAQMYSTIDLNVKRRLWQNDQLEINGLGFLTSSKVVEGDTFSTYGFGFEMNQLTGENGIAVTAQLQPDDEELKLDVVLKRNIISTKDTNTRVDLSVNITKKFSPGRDAQPLGLVLEVSFSRAN